MIVSCDAESCQLARRQTKTMGLDAGPYHLTYDGVGCGTLPPNVRTRHKTSYLHTLFPPAPPPYRYRGGGRPSTEDGCALGHSVLWTGPWGEAGTTSPYRGQQSSHNACITVRCSRYHYILELMSKKNTSQPATSTAITTTPESSQHTTGMAASSMQT